MVTVFVYFGYTFYMNKNKPLLRLYSRLTPKCTPTVKAKHYVWIIGTSIKLLNQLEGGKSNFTCWFFQWNYKGLHNIFPIVAIWNSILQQKPKCHIYIYLQNEQQLDVTQDILKWWILSRLQWTKNIPFISNCNVYCIKLCGILS